MTRTKQRSSGLDSFANAALKYLKEGNHKDRANQLKTREPGFGLLLLWNVIELQLKLIRYHDKIKEGWPIKLVFIQRNWTPLKRLSEQDGTKYNNILGSQKNSLRKLRDEIAHTGKYIDKGTADTYWEDALFVIDCLQTTLPTRDSILEKKKRSDAQVNKIK